MRKAKITKYILKNLSTSELINLAKSLELFVPPNFSKNSLIEEIVELNIELDSLPYNVIKMLPLIDDRNLPLSYGVTEIHLLLRDPMWCFAYWDINEHQLKNIIEKEKQIHLFLRLMTFKTEDDALPYSYEDIDIKLDDRSCYVHTSLNEEVNQVALCYKTKEKMEVLSKSNFIYLPRMNIKEKLCKSESEMDSIMLLSGLKYLQLWHYEHFKNLFEEYNI